MVSLKTLDS